MWKHTLSLAIILIVRISLCEENETTTDYVITTTDYVITTTDYPIASTPKAYKAAKKLTGSDAKPGQFPATVSLRAKYMNDEHFCSGTIVGKSWVVTLGYCVGTCLVEKLCCKERGVYPIVVMAGENRQVPLNMARHVYQVDEIFMHPKWKYLRFKNDIALLRIYKTFPFYDKFVKPLAINEDIELKPRYKVTITGWGDQKSPDIPGGGVDYPDYSFDTASVSNLVYSDLFYVKNGECFQNRNLERKFMEQDDFQRTAFESGSLFCAGDLKNKSSSCFGDPGSGLIYRNKLVGVLSFIECPNTMRGFADFEDVRSHAHWIKETIRKNFANSQKLSGSMILLSFVVFIFIRLIFFSI